MKKKSKLTKTYPRRASDVPVTQKMLYSVRDELKSDIRSLEHNSKSADLRMDSVQINIKSLERKMDSKFEKVDSKLEKMASGIHQIKMIVEEQSARNNIVLDGLTNLFHRQESTNARVDEIEKTLQVLK